MEAGFRFRTATGRQSLPMPAGAGPKNAGFNPRSPKETQESGERKL
jgi:hypothetical protein